MNLTTVLVAVVIAGSATPGIAKMALQPVVAQKRATNFGVAEMQAVTFAAKNEGQISLTTIPEQCDLQDIGNNAFAITCWEGIRKYKMKATRSFRLGALGPGMHNINVTQPSKGGTSSEEGGITNVTQSTAGGTSSEEGDIINVTQPTAGGTTSSEEGSIINVTQSTAGGTSSEEGDTINTTQSSSEGRSGDEKDKMYTTQSSREGRSGDEKDKMDTTQSSREGRSGDEKDKMDTTQSSRDGRSGDEKRSYPHPTPSDLTHYNCPHFDPWGVVSFNKTHLGGKACIPVPLQSPANYAASNPADWLYDISGFGM